MPCRAPRPRPPAARSASSSKCKAEYQTPKCASLRLDLAGAHCSALEVDRVAAEHPALLDHEVNVRAAIRALHLRGDVRRRRARLQRLRPQQHENVRRFLFSCVTDGAPYNLDSVRTGGHDVFFEPARRVVIEHYGEPSQPRRSSIASAGQGPLLPPPRSVRCALHQHHLHAHNNATQRGSSSAASNLSTSS